MRVRFLPRIKWDEMHATPACVIGRSTVSVFCIALEPGVS